MSKGEFDEPIHRQQYDPNIILSTNGDYMGRMSDMFTDDYIDRFITCYNACNGIKGPEKTISKLVEFARRCSWNAHQSNLRTRLRYSRDSEWLDKEADEALEGVSDE